MGDVDYYIQNHEKTIKTILEILNASIMNFPGVISKIRYKIPFYYKKSWICYLNPQKSGGVELAFTRGNELADEQGILERKGRKQVKSITYQSIKDIDEASLNIILQEAMLLDDHVPYASKRKRK